jgi:hypothetical protein
MNKNDKQPVIPINNSFILLKQLRSVYCFIAANLFTQRFSFTIKKTSFYLGCVIIFSFIKLTVMKYKLIKNISCVVIVVLFFSSCQKETTTRSGLQEEISTAANNKAQHGHLQQTKTFSSDVAIRWMNMQIELMRKTTTVGNVAFSRHYAYSGIALYESVVPGMPAYQSIASQLNGLNGLPVTTPGLAYHWAASANAALALINKKMFPNASC